MSDLTNRRAATGDAGALWALMDDIDAFGNLLQPPYPSEVSWRQRLADGLAAGKTNLQLVAVTGGTAIGSAGLYTVSPSLRRRHALSLGIWVLPSAQGSGVGSSLMTALVDYADNWAHALRIELSVYCDNERAIKLYQRHGLWIKGRMRDYALRTGA